MIEFHLTDDDLWDRIERAIQKIRERLERATHLLEAATIPYAVIGGFAVQYWVAKVEEAAIRNTRDVDILLRRADFQIAKDALVAGGFHYVSKPEIPVFLDSPTAREYDAVHILFANEKVRPHYPLPTPDVDEVIYENGFRTLRLEALVRIQLTANRRKDGMHLRDMLSVGLIDQSWVEKMPVELRSRLQEIIDTPDG